MAYLVSVYVGETERLGRPYGFTSRAKALSFLWGVAEDARDDGFRVVGDPLDGLHTIYDGTDAETYTLRETSDLAELRKVRCP